MADTTAEILARMERTQLDFYRQQGYLPPAELVDARRQELSAQKMGGKSSGPALNVPQQRMADTMIARAEAVALETATQELNGRRAEVMIGALDKARAEAAAQLKQAKAEMVPAEMVGGTRLHAATRALAQAQAEVDSLAAVDPERIAGWYYGRFHSFNPPGLPQKPRPEMPRDGAGIVALAEQWSDPAIAQEAADADRAERVEATRQGWISGRGAEPSAAKQ